MSRFEAVHHERRLMRRTSKSGFSLGGNVSMVERLGLFFTGGRGTATTPESMGLNQVEFDELSLQARNLVELWGAACNEELFEYVKTNVNIRIIEEA